MEREEKIIKIKSIVNDLKIEQKDKNKLIFDLKLALGLCEPNTEKFINKRRNLLLKIDELNKEYNILQENCPHEHILSKNGFSDGGYDGPLYDSRWVDNQCLVCGKSWREDK